MSAEKISIFKIKGQTLRLYGWGGVRWGVGVGGVRESSEGRTIKAIRRRWFER